MSESSELRQLTAEGITEAQRFLTRLREQPDGDREPPPMLLYRQPYSRPFNERIVVERQEFDTRREAGAYLSEQLRDVQHLITDDAGVWSWLGMFYFPEIVRVQDGHVQLHADETSLFLSGRAAQRRYRHYLWAAWRVWWLYEQHGDDMRFFLDQPVTDSGDIARAVLDYPRVFTSAGVIQLILQLYTHGQGTKTGFSARQGRPGNVRHLLRVLPQLELTYDVYGMEPNALLEVLPDDFRAWAGASA